MDRVKVIDLSYIERHMFYLRVVHEITKVKILI